MGFSVEGTIAGRRSRVDWRGGTVGGDPWALEAIERLIDSDTVVLVAHPSSWEAALTPAWVALPTIEAVFDPDPLVRGRRPTPPWFRNPPGIIY